jgi:hypothetical protein
MNTHNLAILTVLAEGASIQLFKSDESYFYISNEYYLEEGADLPISKQVTLEFPTFKQAFLSLSESKPIFRLHLDEVDTNYSAELKELLQQLSSTFEEISTSWQDFMKS